MTLTSDLLRLWRFLRLYTGPIAAVSLVVTCVAVVWVLLWANTP